MSEILKLQRRSGNFRVYG